jgi:hypothetical protein
MKRSLQRRLDALAKKIYTAERQPRLLWRETTETAEDVRARIRAMIASGEASPNDRFHTIGWRAEAGEAADH